MNISPVIKRIVNNPTVIKFASDPKWPVAGLIVSNAIFRPAFTLADPNVKPSAKKYSAAREFFHQILCLGSLFLLTDHFKKFGFYLGKKTLGNKSGFEKFKNYSELATYLKKGGNLIKKSPVVNGSLVFGSTVGAIVALAILAPKLNNWLLPPLLNILGIKLENKKDYKKITGIYASSLTKSTSLPRNITASQLKGLNFKA